MQDNRNPKYVRAMQGHAKLLSAFPPALKMEVIEELECPEAINGNLDAAIDQLRAIIWDDAKAAMIWSAVIVALGSDLEAMRQKGDIKNANQWNLPAPPPQPNYPNPGDPDFAVHDDEFYEEDEDDDIEDGDDLEEEW